MKLVSLAVSCAAFAATLWSLGSARPVQAVATLNLPASFADTKAKLTAGQQADILVLGDSLSFYPGNYLTIFRDRLQDYYGDAGAGYQGFSVWTGGGMDAGWNRGFINADTSPYRALDGLWGSTTATTTAYLTPSSERFELHYVTQPGGGSFRPFVWTSGGQQFLAPAIDTNSAAPAVETWTFPAPDPGTQIWYQTFGNGTVTILGENNVNDLDPGVRVHRAANGGWGVENFLHRDWTFDAQLDLLDPDLVMIWLGQNDQGFGRESYRDRLRALIGRVRATRADAEVVLIGTYDSGSANIPPLVGAMQDVASEDGVGFINIHEVAGDYQFFLDNGFLEDGIHFSAAGGWYLGNLLFDAFQTDGLGPRWTGRVRSPFTPFDPSPSAASTPEPGCAAVTSLIGALLLMRRRATSRRV
jgi:lysophospholipase L1-like esterase